MTSRADLRVLVKFLARSVADGYTWQPGEVGLVTVPAANKLLGQKAVVTVPRPEPDDDDAA